MPQKSILRVLLLTLAVAGRFGVAQDQERLRYSVVYSDSAGISHFRDEYLPWQKLQGSDPNTLLSVTPFLDAQKIGYVRIPKAYNADWHRAPSKRFVMNLSGVAEIEAGDGTRRKLGPGDIVLVTDTEGRGHRTKPVDKDIFAVWVPVP
jgi:hypothetical protein